MENKQVQSGTGSAENRGQDRADQVNHSASLSDQEKENVAGEIGVPVESVASIEDTGMTSGRDDQAGGDNDGMEAENTGSETDR